MKISFRKLEDTKSEYTMIYEWCQNDFVYKWFEQRRLSLDEICDKYKSKLYSGKQELLIIQCNNIDIGLVQIYKYNNYKKIDKYKSIYEYDIFIGIKEYLSKGIGEIVVNLITDLIYTKYDADAIVLRPFKRNTRAIKCYNKCNYHLIDEYDDKDTLGNKEKIVVLLNKKH